MEFDLVFDNIPLDLRAPKLRIRQGEIPAQPELLLAVENGDLVELERFHQQEGAILTKELLVAAGEFGHLDCLRYIRESGCKWDILALSSAAWNGHLECVQYALENGCILGNRHLETSTIASAALNCLKYLREEKQFAWDHATPTYAAGKGRLECLKYAHENGCEWNEYACEMAAFGGQLECLQYLLSHGCPYSTRTVENAAGQGHIDCLHCLISNGYSFRQLDVWKGLNNNLIKLDFDQHNGWLRQFLFPHVDEQEMPQQLKDVCKAKIDQIKRTKEQVSVVVGDFILFDLINHCLLVFI